MSNDIVEVLRSFGLTGRESEVYVFLAKSGVRDAGGVSRSMKMHKAQVYRILYSLRGKGLVEITLEHPMRFTVVPFEEALESFIRTRRRQINHLEDKKNELLQHWGAVAQENPAISIEKFMVISGSTNVYSRITQIVEEAKKEIQVLTTSLGIVRSVQAGVDEAVLGKALRNVDSRLRLITQVTEENLGPLKKNLQIISTNHMKNIVGRHLLLESRFYPRFMIKDGEEVVFFIAPLDDSAASDRYEAALWTNCRSLVRTCMIFFDKLWNEAVDIDKRIGELEAAESRRDHTA